jgi:hypothetical protein
MHVLSSLGWKSTIKISKETHTYIYSKVKESTSCIYKNFHQEENISMSRNVYWRSVLKPCFEVSWNKIIFLCNIPGTTHSDVKNSLFHYVVIYGKNVKVKYLFSIYILTWTGSNTGHPHELRPAPPNWKYLASKIPLRPGSTFLLVQHLRFN